jgi:hypothetical protein
MLLHGTVLRQCGMKEYWNQKKFDLEHFIDLNVLVLLDKKMDFGMSFARMYKSTYVHFQQGLSGCTDFIHR